MYKLIFLSALAFTLTSCVTGPEIKPGRFVDAVVSCNAANAHKETIKAEIGKCVAGIVSQNYMRCLDLIPYAADEVLCTIRTLLNLRVASINAGNKNADDIATVRRLNEYLKANRVSFE